MIVQEQMASRGNALPWDDKQAFAVQLASKALEQYNSVNAFDGDTFFDRSVVEAEVFSDLYNLRLPQSLRSFTDICHYADPIFLTPPWQEIFESDAERQHGFEDAVIEHNALQLRFLEKGYSVLMIPQDTIMRRVDWILEVISVEP